MLSKKEKDIIKKCARKYNVSSVFLFGSSLKKRANGNDIDLGIKGLESQWFFKLYAELFKHLPRPVDLVDLDKENNYFSKRIIEEGKIIYEA